MTEHSISKAAQPVRVARPQRGLLRHQAVVGPETTDEAPTSVHRVLQSPGQPLDPAVRGSMERRFDYDFSSVRTHTDELAAESATAVDALGYTVGAHVVFGAGQYAPHTRSGRDLIAHELAHVVAQSGQFSTTVPEQLQISDAGEVHANELAHAAVADEPIGDRRYPSAVVVARQAASAAIPPQRFDERLNHLKKLLSYGILDWAITDAEAIEALRLLQAFSQPERAVALQNIRLDRLIGNLPQRYQPELAKIVAESGGEQIVLREVTNILTYDFFDLIGSVSETEATQALGLLEALPDEKRDRQLDRIPRDKRRRLHDALPPRGKQRFMQLWDEKQEREVQRQQDKFRTIERGAQFLMRVQLRDTKEPLDAFAPEGVAADVNADGDVYYAPFDVFVSIVGRTRTEAEHELEHDLTAKAGLPLTVELKARPAGFVDDYFEVTPRRSAAPLPIPAAAKPQPKPDPLSERQQEFRATIIRQGKHLVDQYALLQKNPKDERLRRDIEIEQGGFNRFYAWFEKNEKSPLLLKVDPATLLGEFLAAATKQTIDEFVQKKIAAEKEARAFTPEVLQARIKKMDEFLHLAVSLRGESAMRYPYLIPVDSEGLDILVTGAPARQAVLNLIAEELMGWSREHMLDDNYPTVDPRSILLYVLKSGYGDALRATDTEPLKAEAIDRHEIILGTTAKAFGKTVAIGLVVIGVVGAAVGLGLLSAGVALIILGAVAAYAGISAYLERRKEIEQKGYDVPIPVTMVHAAGDVLGVSQLIEGITGERLGIGERLKSVERSEQLGGGAGGVALLLLGSRAFRAGQGIGQGLRLSGPGLLPETLEGVALRDLGKEYPPVDVPVKPLQNPNPGPIEAQARATLPERLRVGFDRWVEGMRNNPKRTVDIEKVLGKMKPEAIEKICTEPAEKYYARVEEAKRLSDAKLRSQGDPLRPRLQHNEWKDGVSIHYEKIPPDAGEIAHAKEIQTASGEPVHLFGDTPSGKTFPAIDGTIGEPPRPLQLKTVADPAYLKVHAHDAFESAAKHGYTKLEVHLRVKGSTVAELKAAWEAKPGHMRGAEIGWETRLSLARSKLELARLVIEGKDGTWVVDAPPSSPNLPAVPVPVSGDEKRASEPKK